VRTPEEFIAGHLPNALNINWFNENFVDQLRSISKEETIYIYCKKGGRSTKAIAKLKSLGFKHVIDLERGL